MGCDMFGLSNVEMYQRTALEALWGQQAQSSSLGAFGSPAWGACSPPTPIVPPDFLSAPLKPNKKEEKGMFQNVKDYIGKHRDMLFTLGLIIVVDHFLFSGALRERIKGSIEGMLKKVEDKFHKDEVK
jgi:ribosomal protein L30/L7E